MNTPAPFCFDFKNVKAIVLGADPTNFSDHGSRKELTNVFGIGSGDPRYFKDILVNIEAIGLNIFDIYVQNLVPVYLEKETSKNKDWEKTAEKWLPILKDELNGFDPDNKIPVLVTAERIMKFLSMVPIPAAGKIYSCEEPGIIDNKNSKLDRKLVPFYRYFKYSLVKEGNKKYRDMLAGMF